jgi:CheY-like chemotaxis protein
VSPARILVIDDEIPLLKICARALRPHLVEVASSGALALARLATLPAFDVVFCDLNLPDLHGRDLYRLACARSPELRPRFVFMTGDHVSNPPGLDDDFNAVRVLSKPFECAELRAVLHDMLSRLPPLAEP